MIASGLGFSPPRARSAGGAFGCLPARLPALRRPVWLWALLACCLALSPQLSTAQSLSELKSTRRRLENKVKLTEKLIRQTRNVRQKSFNELKLLKKQIAYRKQLLTNLQAEMRELQRSIDKTSSIITAMRNDIERLRESVREVARVTYRQQRPMNMMLWLMSSESFGQFYDRLVYFRKFADFRQEQIELLNRTRSYLTSRLTELEQQRQQKKQVLRLQLKEKRKLDVAQRKKDILYRQLRTKERTYKKELKTVNKELQQVQAEILDLIKRSKSTQATDIINKLSADFERNKGKFPWPLPMPKGIITGKFGRTVDESGGELQNDGIYLSTTSGQPIRSVFKGKVTAVSELPLVGKVVILQHGRYRTVYANLKKVMVKTGDEVETLQDIGVVKTNPKTGDARLHFLIYKDFEPVNPLVWIVRKD